MELQTPKRRSRRVRSRTKTPIQISERDIKILRTLHRHRYARSRMLVELLGGEVTNFLNRLSKLNDHGYINRPARQWEYVNAYYQPAVYELDRKGEELLEGEGYQLTFRGQSDNPNFRHDLMVSDCLMAIEIAASKAGLRFIPVDEILSRGPLKRLAFPIAAKIDLKPDGLFGIEYPTGVILYAIECDRGTEPLKEREHGGSSYERKLKQYESLIDGKTYQTLLNVKAGLMVLHVTVFEDRVANIMALAGNGRYNLFRHVPYAYRWTETKEALETLLTHPWKRQGHAPFSIEKAA